MKILIKVRGNKEFLNAERMNAEWITEKKSSLIFQVWNSDNSCFDDYSEKDITSVKIKYKD